jgi:hypothetical protein
MMLLNQAETQRLTNYLAYNSSAHTRGTVARGKNRRTGGGFERWMGTLQGAQ